MNNNNLGKSYAQVAKDFRVERIELKERVTGKREVQIQVEKLLSCSCCQWKGKKAQYLLDISKMGFIQRILFCLFSNFFWLEEFF